jgi:signal peptidase
MINLATYVLSILMLWRCLIVFTGTESPVVVVLSGSMEPAFFRGDILFLSRNFANSPIKIGDIVVYNIKGRDIPIVHRVIELHQKNDPMDLKLLTKGDANRYDDRQGIYEPGQIWLQESDVLGRAYGCIRYAGYFTIFFNEYPIAKFLILGLMTLLVIANKVD